MKRQWVYDDFDVTGPDLSDHQAEQKRWGDVNKEIRLKLQWFSIPIGPCGAIERGLIRTTIRYHVDAPQVNELNLNAALDDLKDTLNVEHISYDLSTQYALSLELWPHDPYAIEHVLKNLSTIYGKLTEPLLLTGVEDTQFAPIYQRLAMSDGSPLPGPGNILMVGDTGCGKSEWLQTVEQIARATLPDVDVQVPSTIDDLMSLPRPSNTPVEKLHRLRLYLIDDLDILMDDPEHGKNVSELIAYVTQHGWHHHQHFIATATEPGIYPGLWRGYLLGRISDAEGAWTMMGGDESFDLSRLENGRFYFRDLMDDKHVLHSRVLISMKPAEGDP